MNDPAMNQPANNGTAIRHDALNRNVLNENASDPATPSPESAGDAGGPAAGPAANSRETALALFRAHATARLRGDAAEAARLTAAIGDERRMIHHMFTLALFTQVVYTELGDRPDPCDLAELTRVLHDKHARRNRRFKAIKAEALIRAVCGEPLLLTEISYAEQPAYLWAVITELVPTDETDAALAARFDTAEESGTAWRDAVLEEPFFAPRQDTPAHPGAESDPDQRPDPGPEPEPEPEAAQPNRQEP